MLFTVVVVVVAGTVVVVVVAGTVVVVVVVEVVVGAGRETVVEVVEVVGGIVVVDDVVGDTCLLECHLNDCANRSILEVQRDGVWITFLLRMCAN